MLNVKAHLHDQIVFIAKDYGLTGDTLIGESDPIYFYDVMCNLVDGGTYREHYDVKKDGKVSGIINFEFFAHPVDSDV